MNSNFGLLEPLEQRIRRKREKRERLSERGAEAFAAWMAGHDIAPVEVPSAAAAAVA